MKVVVTGCDGQLGRALRKPPDGVTLIPYGRCDLDILQADWVAEEISKVAPDLIINAAAYTAVDKAESEPERAFALNRDGVANLAATGVRLVQVSTDFVFDGLSSSPYPVDAPAGPLGVYGESKLAGEKAAGEDALIVRTSWVYLAYCQNFVYSMLRLMRERGSVCVVSDQIGTPTCAISLAEAIWALVLKEARGIYHYTDSGVASWYDFAVAIAEEAHALGILDSMPEVVPISSDDFPTPARRPAYSVLDKSKTTALLGSPAPHWRVNLRKMLLEVQAHG